MLVLQGGLVPCLSLVAQGSCKLIDRVLVYTLLVERLSLLGVALEEPWLHFVRLIPRKSLQYKPCSVKQHDVCDWDWSLWCWSQMNCSFRPEGFSCNLL